VRLGKQPETLLGKDAADLSPAGAGWPALVRRARIKGREQPKAPLGKDAADLSLAGAGWLVAALHRGADVAHELFGIVH
jgi:hypothetical protein